TGARLRLRAIEVDRAVAALPGAGDATPVAGGGVAVVTLLRSTLPIMHDPVPAARDLAAHRAIVGVRAVAVVARFGSLDHPIPAARRARPCTGRATAIVGVVDARLTHVGNTGQTTAIAFFDGALLEPVA